MLANAVTLSLTWVPFFPSLLQTALPTHPVDPKTVATCPLNEER